jgi:hypothetical protein
MENPEKALSGIMPQGFNAKTQRRKGATGGSGFGFLSAAKWLWHTPLCSAISRIPSFLTKLFHHEEHEGHEVLNLTNCTILLRELRVLRGENWVPAMPRWVFAASRLCVEIARHLPHGPALEFISK